MPLVYQQNINETTRLGVWHIAEPENFFLKLVPLQREITHPHKRLQHLAGRYLLKELYPDFPYGMVRIADTRKPFLENEAYHFSISHSSDYAAVMVSSTCRVGVDVESVSEKVIKIKNKFLSAIEMDMVESLGAHSFTHHQSSALLTLAWSIKESLFKWHGSGGVDFKEQLVIEEIILNDQQGIAHCKLLKGDAIQLTVHFLLFNDKCIAWVFSDVLQVS